MKMNKKKQSVKFDDALSPPPEKNKVYNLLIIKTAEPSKEMSSLVAYVFSYFFS